jgi:hypothetical protein
MSITDLSKSVQDTDVENLTEENIKAYFEKICESDVDDFLVENDFDGIRKRTSDKFREKLIGLVEGCQALDIASDKKFPMEHDNESCFYIEFLKIFEHLRGDELILLLCNFIKGALVDDEYDRIVGILCNSYGNKNIVSRERYHLVPAIAPLLKKSSLELLFIEESKSSEEIPSFSLDGVLGEKKNDKRERLIIVDEMISTGENIMKAIEYLHNCSESPDVKDVFVLLNRSSTDNFLKIQKYIFDTYKVNVYCVLMLEDLLNSLLTNKLIQENDYNMIMREIKGQMP